MTKPIPEPQDHPGYIGAFHKGDYEKAEMKMGDRCQKRNSEPGDRFPDGTLGKVLGSVGHPSIEPCYFYYVEWDPMPGVAIAILDERLMPAEAK